MALASAGRGRPPSEMSLRVASGYLTGFANTGANLFLGSLRTHERGNRREIVLPRTRNRKGCRYTSLQQQPQPPTRPCRRKEASCSFGSQNEPGEEDAQVVWSEPPAVIGRRSCVLQRTRGSDVFVMGWGHGTLKNFA